MCAQTTVHKCSWQNYTNSPKGKTTQRYVNWWMVTHTLKYYSAKRNEVLDACYNTDEFWKYATQKQIVTRDCTLYDFTFMNYSK